MFCSEEPTSSLNTRPMSSLSRGNCHWLATALAKRDFPAPCTPSNSNPLGSGRPKCRARSLKANPRLRSHSLSSAMPPT